MTLHCSPGGRARFAFLAGIGAIAMVASGVSPAQASGDVMQPYSARYAVYRNGKLTARAEVQLLKQGENWLIKSESVGTHGMARFLKFRDYEYVEGYFKNQRFLPVRYVHELKWMGPNQDSAADFDWEAKRVTVTTDGETATLELAEGALDPMSLLSLSGRRQISVTGRGNFSQSIRTGWCCARIRARLCCAKRHFFLLEAGWLDRARRWVFL
jgi:hypothetical protein